MHCVWELTPCDGHHENLQRLGCLNHDAPSMGTHTWWWSSWELVVWGYIRKDRTRFSPSIRGDKCQWKLRWFPPPLCPLRQESSSSVLSISLSSFQYILMINLTWRLCVPNGFVCLFFSRHAFNISTCRWWLFVWVNDVTLARILGSVNHFTVKLSFGMPSAFLFEVDSDHFSKKRPNFLTDAST